MPRNSNAPPANYPINQKGFGGAEAAWHGLALAPDFIGGDAGRRIKPQLIALLSRTAPFALDDKTHKRLIGLMVNLTL